MNSKELLNLAKQRLAVESDYMFAKITGFSRTSVSNWQNGLSMSDEHAVKVAEICGLPVSVVIAWVHAERSKCPQAKAALQQAADQLLSLAA